MSTRRKSGPAYHERPTKPTPEPLSKEAKEARRPIPPGIALDTLHGKVHEEPTPEPAATVMELLSATDEERATPPPVALSKEQREALEATLAWIPRPGDMKVMAFIEAWLAESSPAVEEEP